MLWDKKNLEKLAVAITTEFPYTLPRFRIRALKNAKFVPSSQVPKIWKTYDIGLRAYLILFDQLLTGCRHSAKFLLPDNPAKAHEIYLECRKLHYSYRYDLVNNLQDLEHQGSRPRSYSPADIPFEYDLYTPDYPEHLPKVPSYVQLTEEIRPPAPVRRLTAEEYFAEKAKENQRNADKELESGTDAMKRRFI
jgi:hypothetical protein